MEEKQAVRRVSVGRGEREKKKRKEKKGKKTKLSNFFYGVPNAGVR